MFSLAPYEWVEENRLECSTFHILTPYPATPLFKQMEAAGRLLHRDWTLHDTAHAVFRPKHMSPEELEQGYAVGLRAALLPRFDLATSARRLARGCYPTWRCRICTSVSNRFWHLLIKHDLVHCRVAASGRINATAALTVPEGAGPIPKLKVPPPGNMMPAGVVALSIRAGPEDQGTVFSIVFPKAQRRGRENWPRFCVVDNYGNFSWATSSGQKRRNKSN